MKLLMVGSNHHWAIENIYLKYLKELNKQTYLFPAQNLFHEYFNSSLLNKILFRTGLSSIYKKINIHLLQYVEELRPDIIWVFKGMEVLPETLKIFRGKKIKLVNYNPDHPFIRSGRGSWNKNVIYSVGLYDLHFCYSKLLMKKIQEDYKIKTEWLPFGYELDNETFEKVSQLPEINKLCFLGNPDNIRAELINHLSKNKIPIDVYGHNWKRFLQENDYLKIYDAVSGIKFWEILRQYRVQLNIFRPHNIGSHNMRTFEIPAVGGIQLAPDSPEHREFFEDGKEIFLYKNNDQLVDKAIFLLQSSDENIQNFRGMARLRSVKSDYSYKDRTIFVYDLINKI